MNKLALISISILLLSIFFSGDFDACAKSSKRQNSIYLPIANLADANLKDATIKDVDQFVTKTIRCIGQSFCN